MKFDPNGNSDEFIELIENGLEYNGPRDLTQYFIRSLEIEKTLRGTVITRVVLGRRLLGMQIILVILKKYCD